MGDFSGDGFGDLAVSVPGENLGGKSTVSAVDEPCRSPSRARIKRGLG
jgi:hypothetical protein